MTAPPASTPPWPGLAGLPRSDCSDPCPAGSPGSRLNLAEQRAAAAAALMASLLAWGLLLAFASVSAALAQTEVDGLQCRLSGGPWQPCRMEVRDVGLHWVLRVGELRIEFRHGGDGAVRMQKGAGPWQPVRATWQPDTSLCWDGVCAKGDIPLD